MDRSEELIRAALELRQALRRLHFSSPVTHVYHPLDYAWAAHEIYIRKFGASKKDVIFLGMNPGPFGMAQTGVPFGEVRAVQEWMKISVEIERPAIEHAKRPVLGFRCPRSEVSGRRLWGLFERRFVTLERFFQTHFVVNYCPILFLEGSGCNRTPDKLPASELEPVKKACNRHLEHVVQALGPKWVIGVGKFAEDQARSIRLPDSVKVGTILHPSPASPASNKDWDGKVTAQLKALGVWT